MLNSQRILADASQRLTQTQVTAASNAKEVLRKFVEDFKWTIKEAKMVRPQRDSELAVGVYMVPDDKARAMGLFLRERGFKETKYVTGAAGKSWSKNVPDLGEVYVTYLDEFGVLCVSIFAA